MGLLNSYGDEWQQLKRVSPSPFKNMPQDVQVTQAISEEDKTSELVVVTATGTGGAGTTATLSLNSELLKSDIKIDYFGGTISGLTAGETSNVNLILNGVSYEIIGFDGAGGTYNFSKLYGKVLPKNSTCILLWTQVAGGGNFTGRFEGYKKSSEVQ